MFPLQGMLVSTQVTHGSFTTTVTNPNLSRTFPVLALKVPGRRILLSCRHTGTVHQPAGEVLPNLCYLRFPSVSLYLSPHFVSSMTLGQFVIVKLFCLLWQSFALWLPSIHLIFLVKSQMRWEAALPLDMVLKYTFPVLITPMSYSVCPFKFPMTPLTQISKTEYISFPLNSPLISN